MELTVEHGGSGGGGRRASGPPDGSGNVPPLVLVVVMVVMENPGIPSAGDNTFTQTEHWTKPWSILRNVDWKRRRFIFMFGGSGGNGNKWSLINPLVLVNGGGGRWW